MALEHYVTAFVMGGGGGTRLKILTKERSKPAVSTFGIYRLIDIVMTNVANTGIHSAFIATQFEPRSLNWHIGNGRIYGFDNMDRKLEIVHPYQEAGKFITFEGTADSVRQNIHRVKQYEPKIVMVLGGDHVYGMNYTRCINQHINSNADITIMANLIEEKAVSDCGIMKIDNSGRITDFGEKLKNQEEIETFRLTPRIKERLGITDANKDFLASMGNYVFSREKLEEILKEYPGNDFGRDIIPSMKKNNANLQAYIFNGYWRDVGKISDYFDCNMEFAISPPIDLIANRIRTARRELPPAWFGKDVKISQSLLGLGDEIYDNTVIEKSVLGYQVRVEKACTLEYCILNGADRNEFFDNKLRRENITLIGEGSELKYVILDKNVRIGKDVNINPDKYGYEERIKKLERIGLKPYVEHKDGRIEGDFYLDKETGLLVIAKQRDPNILMFPDGFEC